MRNLTTTIQGVTRPKVGGKKKSLVEVNVTPELRAALAFVTSAWVGPDGRMRFEFPNRAETRLLVTLFSKEDTPSVVYMRADRDLSYRWTVSANKWRRAFVAWKKMPGNEEGYD